MNQLTVKNFFTDRAVVALLLYVCVNLIVSSATPKTARTLDASVIRTSNNESRQEGKWTWWVTRNFLKCEPTPEIALMGSSQMGAAVFSSDAKTLGKNLDCVTHRSGTTMERAIEKVTGARLHAYNFAMGGSMVSDAFMIAKSLFTGDRKPKMIILGIGPRDFMDNTLESPSATEPFAFYAPYVELGPLKSEAFSDGLGWLAWTIDHDLPLKHTHAEIESAIAAYSHEDKLAITRSAPDQSATAVRQPLQGVFGGPDEVKPGKWLISSDIPDSMFEDNTKEYLRRYKTTNPPIYQKEQAFFASFLAFAKAEHIPVLVVGMPSLLANRSILPAQFWTDFKTNISNLCQANDASWVDISEDPDFKLEDYLDTVHLNAKGGQKLFSKLALILKENARLAAVIDCGQKANSTFSQKLPNQASTGLWQ